MSASDPFVARLERYLDRYEGRRIEDAHIEFIAHKTLFFARWTTALPIANISQVICSFDRLTDPCVTPRDDEVAPLNQNDKKRIESTLTRILAPTVDFLRSNVRLDCVELKGGYQRSHPIDEMVKSLVLKAIGGNPNVEVLKCSSYIPYHSLPQFLRTTETLIRFEFATSSTSNCDDESTIRHIQTIYAEIPLALGSNSSLETLIIEDRDMKHPDFVNAVLTQVASHPTLETLVLRSSYDTSDPPLHSISILMQSTSLSFLKIEGRCIEEAFWDELISMLHSPYDTPVPMITLVDCPFEKKVAKRFRELVQSPKQSTEGSDTKPCINLTLSFEFEEDNEFSLFPRHGNDAWLTHSPYISSLLVVPCHSPIKVSTLRLRVTTENQVKAVAYHLPQAVYLERLTLDLRVSEDGYWADAAIPEEVRYADHALTPTLLLEGIRTNGSLLHFHHSEERIGSRPAFGLEGPFFTDEMIRKIDAYTERNRNVPWLLDTLDPSVETELLSLPMLFAVATPAHRTAPTQLLNGLLHVDDEMIGPSVALTTKRVVS